MLDAAMALTIADHEVSECEGDNLYDYAQVIAKRLGVADADDINKVVGSLMMQALQGGLTPDAVGTAILGAMHWGSILAHAAAVEELDSFDVPTHPDAS